MLHLKHESPLARSLLSFLEESCLGQQFSTSSAVSKRSKKPWPSGGSWEYAIADYKLRKEAGLNFWDVGLPAGAEALEKESSVAEANGGAESPASEATPAALNEANEAQVQSQAPPPPAVPSARRTRDEEGKIAQEKAQFTYALRRAQARKAAYESGQLPYVRVINHAGADRAGWRNLWRDNKTGHALWEMDLTGGRCPLNERNACLSRKSKTFMVSLYREGKSIKELAELFRVRQQRVMAIIAISIVEQRNEKAGKPMHDHFQLQMEGDYIVHPDGDYVHSGIDPCFEAVGSGEKHVKILPRAPHYEGKKKDQEGKQVARDWAAEEEQLAAVEEQHLVAEFADKLSHNVGLIGEGLHRNISKDKPSRPRGGYSLLVKDLGAPAAVKREAMQSAEAPKRDCYVALPTGGTRELNDDEKFMQYSQRIRARRKL